MECTNLGFMDCHLVEGSKLYYKTFGAMYIRNKLIDQNFYNRILISLLYLGNLLDKHHVLFLGHPHMISNLDLVQWIVSLILALIFKRHWIY